MATIEAVPMSRQARFLYASVGVAIMALWLGGLLYIAASPIEKVGFLLAFFGGMSMVLTP